LGAFSIYRQYDSKVWAEKKKLIDYYLFVGCEDIRGKYLTFSAWETENCNR